MSLNYLIDSYIDSQHEIITGEDDNGRYEICHGCNQKIYECDTVLPLEDCCNKCMYGEEDWKTVLYASQKLIMISIFL